MIYLLPTDTCYGIACALTDKKSYEKIYKIKKRSFDKPLAIMVPDFKWLAKNTSLTPEQIDFLKNYPRAFTILTQAPAISLYLRYEDSDEAAFINKDVYQNIGIRVAQNDIEESLCKEVGPIWLTSGNLSGEGEIYSYDQIEEQFSYFIEKGTVEVLGSFDLDDSVPPSDVFYFVDEGLEVEYIRKA